MRMLIAAAAVSLLFAGTAHADKAPSFNRKGIAAYTAGRFDESVQRFTDALVERPKSPEIRFNRGTALSALGRKDEAVNELDTAARSFPGREMAAAAHYNAGNALFAAEDYAGALDQYRQAVKLDQKSEDIRHNLELAARKLRDQRKNNQDKDQKKDQDDKKDRQDQKKQNEQKKQDQKKQKQEQQKQQQQRNPETRPMTKEEAERLLNAINDEEKKSLSLRNEQMKASIQQGDDW